MLLANLSIIINKINNLKLLHKELDIFYKLISAKINMLFNSLADHPNKIYQFYT